MADAQKVKINKRKKEKSPQSILIFCFKKSNAND